MIVIPFDWLYFSDALSAQLELAIAKSESEELARQIAEEQVTLLFVSNLISVTICNRCNF